ncbi:hypothetical protein N7540_008893 [Penicillium herquei]|nr:hypothetical protein N7540_008893 [Penicillium herquei]
MEVVVRSSRKSTRRSRNGCRTCRARHIKCDEAPGACNNCTSTKRHCDGYDLGRLQGKKKKASVAELQDVGIHLGWVATSDEQRCFSFFMHRSVPDLTDLFNAPLWQKQALQMSLGDRAVYHAANMLGALHEDSNDNNMRLSGENLRRSQHRVALEQASRSFAHLHARKASQDPQFQEVVLLCCLLFIMGDMVLGRYENAFNHLRSGLRVLKEAHQKQNINKCLLETYARLNALSPHFGTGQPLLFPALGLGSPELDLNICPFKTPADVHKIVCGYSNVAVPFLAKCWSLSPAQRAADYFELACERDILLASFRRVELMLDDFYREFEPKATYQERKGIELLRLQIPGHYISLETCLMEGPAPESYLPSFTRHMAAHERFMALFPERPTISLGHGVIPALGVVVTRGPTYSIRLRALDALSSWPHCEGFLNSNVVACVGIECLKAELLRKGQGEIPVFNENEREELTKFWSETMKSVPHLENWSPVRSAQILQEGSA